MGFRKFFGIENHDGWVESSATVVSNTGYRGRGVKQNCKIELDLEGPGGETTRVSWHGFVHREKWPSVGISLPVLINPEDREDVDIAWDRVEKKSDRAG